MLRVDAVAAVPGPWRTVAWRNRREAYPWSVSYRALRVTPAHDWRSRRLGSEVWLLIERLGGTTPRIEDYFVYLTGTAPRHEVGRLAHHRWAIELQYQELKSCSYTISRGAHFAAGITMWCNNGCLQSPADRAPSPPDSRDLPGRTCHRVHPAD